MQSHPQDVLLTICIKSITDPDQNKSAFVLYPGSISAIGSRYFKKIPSEFWTLFMWHHFCETFKRCFSKNKLFKKIFFEEDHVIVCEFKLGYLYFRIRIQNSAAYYTWDLERKCMGIYNNCTVLGPKTNCSSLYLQWRYRLPVKYNYN